MVDVKTLLGVLPRFSNSSEILIDDQDVDDIIEEIFQSHLIFARDYDLIYKYFDTHNVPGTCRILFDFCKKNIRYTVETQEDQTVRSPSAILAAGNSGGDCKHYASFIAGVLSAISRNTNQKIKWCYRYSNYDIFSDVPGHVFVVVTHNGNEYWIDPVLSKFNERVQPNFYYEDKIPDKMLRRISGIQTDNTTAIDELLNNTKVAAVLSPDDFKIDMPYDLHQAIVVLMNAGVMNAMGEVDEDRANEILTGKNDNRGDVEQAIQTLQYYAQDNTLGSWFGDVFKFIQHNAAILGMQVPRAAFLGLVRLNAFGYATKLERGLTYDDVHAKMADLWERVGGKFSELVNSIGIGAKKKALLKGVSVGCSCGGNGNCVGCVETVSAAACLIASAAIIVAAIIPVINSFLKKHNDPVASQIPVDPRTGLPVGYDQGNGIVSWLQGNPVIVIGGILLIGLFLTSKNTA